MGHEKFSEKRKYLRFDMQTPVNVQLDPGKFGQGPSEKVLALTKNLSVEGVCFISDKKLEPTEIIKMELLLPNQKEPLHLGGEVVWSIPVTLTGGVEKFETGVRLFTIQKSDETRFIDFVYNKTMQIIKDSSDRG